MNQDIKKLWVDALRSGDYKQGKRTLRNGDYFCCLGVLCELATQAGACHAHNLDNDAGSYSYDLYFASLPTKVREWAGFGHRNPSIKGKYLSEYNDDLDYTFDEIAALIEENL